MRSVPGNATERQRIIFWFASFVNRLADWFGIAAGARALAGSSINHSLRLVSER
jgi:hypothetical protein